MSESELTLGAQLVSLSLHRLQRQNIFPSFQLPLRSESIFRIGKNIWRRGIADKASFLIDADQFYRSFAEAAWAAKEQIIILGWDTDSRTRIPLTEDTFGQVGSLELGEFLRVLTERRPELKIYILSWDFAFIYMFEREAFPRMKFGKINTDRIDFRLDHSHPALGSHHQKIVVVDDRIAFSGGLDLTQRRWDTPEHYSFDRRRVDPGGHCYGPFHDVQICMSGEAARHLGELARERWFKATGEVIFPPQNFAIKQSDFPHSFPLSARVDLQNVEVGISRTLPIARNRRPVKEVERLFLDCIRVASKFIYIENQYLTSLVIARALARRLREADGPEVIIILPRDQTGWIEEATMGLLRSRALRHLKKNDRFDRFRCYYPVVPGLETGYVKVHSKVMIVDDLLVRIGSANMNNRSLGLDTECDIIIEAGENVETKISIGRLRRELLGEHLGVDAAEFEARFLINGSLVDTVESFRNGERTLVPLLAVVPEWVRFVMPPGDWIDPLGPKGIRRWFAKKVFHFTYTCKRICGRA